MNGSSGGLPSPSTPIENTLTCASAVHGTADPAVPPINNSKSRRLTQSPFRAGDSSIWTYCTLPDGGRKVHTPSSRIVLRLANGPMLSNRDSPPNVRCASVGSLWRRAGQFRSPNSGQPQALMSFALSAAIRCVTIILALRKRCTCTCSTRSAFVTRLC